MNLSVDGAALVALGAPRDAKEMRAFLDVLGPVALQLAGPALQVYTDETPPAELSLYGRPTWIYRPQDDRFLSEVVASGRVGC